MATAPTPTLLGIPRELRDIIYAAALVSDTPIQLSTRERHIEPAILRVCRQTRDEAIGVYYNRNKFHYTVCRFNGTAMKPFLRKRAKYAGKNKQDKPTASLCRCRHCKRFGIRFRQLEAWIRAVHGSPDTFPYPLPAPGNGTPAPRDIVNQTAVMAFPTIAAMRDQPEAEVARFLLHLKITIAALERNFSDIEQEARWHTSWPGGGILMVPVLPQAMNGSSFWKELFGALLFLAGLLISGTVILLMGKRGLRGFPGLNVGGSLAAAAVQHKRGWNRPVYRFLLGVAIAGIIGAVLPILEGLL